MRVAACVLCVSPWVPAADGPFSVTDRRRVPPSGDKHDFFTLAPYWWPDPAKIEWDGFVPLLERAATVWRADQYRTLADRLRQAAR